jgi:hypothetical protein
MRKPHLVRLAPQGWIQQHEQQPALRLGEAPEDYPEQTVSVRQSRAAPRTTAVSQETARVWARLLAKVYEVDALRCNRCGSPMKVLALITDPQQCRRILLHLIKTGAAPPGLDISALNCSSSPPSCSRAVPCLPCRSHGAFRGARLHDPTFWRWRSPPKWLRWSDGWVSILQREVFSSTNHAQIRAGNL